MYSMFTSIYLSRFTFLGNNIYVNPIDYFHDMAVQVMMAMLDRIC